MNSQSNTKTTAKSQSVVDACAESNSTINRKQSISDIPNIFLIHHAGKSPPGCSRSSASSLSLHPDINRIACKGNRINNKEEIKYNKAKANFIL